MVNCFEIGASQLYDLFTIYISSIALLLYNLCQYREKRMLPSNISKIILIHCKDRCPDKANSYFCLLIFAEIVLISLFQHGLVCILNNLLGELLHTGANYFGMIFAMPVLLCFYCWVVGVDPLSQIDLITPAYPLALFFMKLGCFCVGCCEGVVCDFGMYNQLTGKVEFPVQLVEAGIALLLFFFLHFYRKKAQKGILLPIYIILYCAIRFFSEFLRADPGFRGPWKLYQFLCVLGFAYGLVQYAFLRFCRPFVERFFSNTLPILVQHKR